MMYRRHYIVGEYKQKRTFYDFEKEEVCVIKEHGEAVVSLGGAYAPPKILIISYSDQFFTIYAPP
jgi:hypothetical protein